MWRVFADPKTGFVFKRIFGAEDRKHLLIGLLNALLELDEAHRIVAVQHLPADQRIAVSELKLSILDVKCTDATGTRYVVEMQFLHVKGFEKRVVYNVAKAYAMQLRGGDDYPTLNDVVGVTICDFVLWPERDERGAFRIPMLSLWRMQEQRRGELGLSQLRFAFLELPKYAAGDAPRTLVESGLISFARRRTWTSSRRRWPSRRSWRRSKSRAWCTSPPRSGTPMTGRRSPSRTRAAPCSWRSGRAAAGEARDAGEAALDEGPVGSAPRADRGL